MRADLYSMKALRRGLVSLLFGRFVSAVLMMLAMVLIARALDVASFGVYAMLLSTLALALTYTGLGMDWVGARYLPEYRVHGSSADLRRFLSTFVAVRTVSLLAFAAAGTAAAGWIAGQLGMGEHAAVFGLYLWVILLEGIVRSLRGDVFEPMFQQTHSQANAALRGFVFLGLLAWQMQDGLTLAEVVLGDLVAAGASLAVAVAQVLAYAARHLKGHERAEGWQPPPLRDVLAIGGHNYVAQLINSLANANTLMLVGAAMIGPAAVAGFGFCRTFAEQIRRYLPITLLIPLARPKIVAAYSVDNDFGRLLGHVQFLYKANLMVLMPAVILAATFGDVILEAISGGKYGDARLVAVGFAVYLVLASHRVVLSLVTNILGRPELTTVGSIASVVALPLGVALLLAGFGAEGLVTALVLGEFVSHLVIIHQLYRRGYPYRFDVGGYAKVLASAVAAMAVSFALPRFETMPAEVLTFGVPILVFGLLSLLFLPFTGTERTTLQSLLGRRRTA